MSQILSNAPNPGTLDLARPAGQSTDSGYTGSREDFSEFDYKPVAVLAPVSLFFGLCSLASLIAAPAMTIGLLGVIFGVLCLWQIRKSDGELGGKLLASLGIAMSVLFSTAGGSYHAYVYATEVPEGFERVSFSWLSKQAPMATPQGLAVTPEVAALDGKPVFIKGYMYPTRQQFGLNEFVLVKDNGDCCFGGQPKITDMVVVQLQEGMTVNHRDQQLVSVAGVFRARQQIQSGQLVAIYSLEGTYFK